MDTEISINTPALLFPAITLLMLAYTNRFLALASLIRNLHTKYKQVREERSIIREQIRNLNEAIVAGKTNAGKRHYKFLPLRALHALYFPGLPTRCLQYFWIESAVSLTVAGPFVKRNFYQHKSIGN